MRLQVAGVGKAVQEGEPFNFRAPQSYTRALVLKERGRRDGAMRAFHFLGQWQQTDALHPSSKARSGGAVDTSMRRRRQANQMPFICRCNAARLIFLAASDRLIAFPEPCALELRAFSHPRRWQVNRQRDGRSSSARFSWRTLTRGSPRTPSCRPWIWFSTNWRTASSVRCRAEATVWTW